MTYKWHSRNEIIFHRRIMLKHADIHAKEAHQKRERQEDESDPAEAPEAGVELE
jgi:hypothetical protein